MKRNKMNVTKRVKIVITLLLVFLFQQLSSKIGTYAANIFDYSTIDKYDVFARISVHHIVQAIIALILITLLSKTYNIDFGIKLGDKKTGIKHVKIFIMPPLVKTIF